MPNFDLHFSNIHGERKKGTKYLLKVMENIAKGLKVLKVWKNAFMCIDISLFCLK